VEIHAQVALGASYRLSNDLDLTVEAAVTILEDGLAATAGLIRKPSKTLETGVLLIFRAINIRSRVLIPLK